MLQHVARRRKGRKGTPTPYSVPASRVRSPPRGKLRRGAHHFRPLPASFRSQAATRRAGASTRAFCCRRRRSHLAPAGHFSSVATISASQSASAFSTAFLNAGEAVSPDYAQPRSGKMLGRVQTLGPRALAGGPDVEGPDAVCAARTARCVRGLDRCHRASPKPLPPIPGGTGGRGDLASAGAEAPLRFAPAPPLCLARRPSAAAKVGPVRDWTGG
jgi:hypothetical protein